MCGRPALRLGFCRGGGGGLDDDDGDGVGVWSCVVVVCSSEPGDRLACSCGILAPSRSRRARPGAAAQVLRVIDRSSVCTISLDEHATCSPQLLLYPLSLHGPGHADTSPTNESMET